MKKIVLVGLMFLHGSTFSMQYLKDQFCSPQKQTRYEQVEDAIRFTNLKQVMKLVRLENTSVEELNSFLRMTRENFGKSPAAKLNSKAAGLIKVIFGCATFYRTGHGFYKSYWNSATKAEPNTRSILENIRKKFSTSADPDKSLTHELILEIAAIGTLWSAYGAICLGLNILSPKADPVSNFMIQLYLQDLANKAKPNVVMVG